MQVQDIIACLDVEVTWRDQLCVGGEGGDDGGGEGGPEEEGHQGQGGQAGQGHLTPSV